MKTLHIWSYKRSVARAIKSWLFEGFKCRGILNMLYKIQGVQTVSLKWALVSVKHLEELKGWELMFLITKNSTRWWKCTSSSMSCQELVVCRQECGSCRPVRVFQQFCMLLYTCVHTDRQLLLLFIFLIQPTLTWCAGICRGIDSMRTYQLEE